MARTLRNGIKCQALDENGKKCSRPAATRQNYHGDGELYNGYDNAKPTWVRVALCEKHKVE